MSDEPVSRALGGALLTFVALATFLVTTVNAATSPVSPPVILSIAISPRLAPAAGGKVVLRVRVKDARTCTFGDTGGQFTERCADGVATAVVNLLASNVGARAKDLVWVQASGAGGRSARRTISIPQAAEATACTGPCTFTFPSVNAQGAVSVTMNSVTQAIAWPGPYDNDVPSGDQLDDVNLTICAGSTGMTAGTFLSAFGLTLPAYGEGTRDVNAWNDAPDSFNNANTVGPGQCLKADLYYDVPVGTAWASVTFTYSTGDPRIVYTWNA